MNHHYVDIVSRFKDIPIAVIGDYMVDEYIIGNVSRISPEAPVTVIHAQDERKTVGGAGNVAANISTLGGTVDAITVIGRDSESDDLIAGLKAVGVNVDGVIVEPHRETTKKTRLLAQNQQIARIDRETTTVIAKTSEQVILEYFKQNREKYKCLVISDYRKGVLTPGLLYNLFALAKQTKIPIVVDPKMANLRAYRGATLVKPNLNELEAAIGRQLKSEDDFQDAMRTVIEEIDAKHLVVTRGAQGIMALSKDGAFASSKLWPRDVYDVTGAGDTVCAVLALSLATKVPIDTAIEISNVAASIVIGRMGTYALKSSELIDTLRGGRLGNRSTEKTQDLDSLGGIIQELKAKNKSIVFTNGCFDLLHVGHVHLLEKAKALGDILVVGVNSDTSVKRLKGDLRPLIGQDDRQRILAAMDTVDYVTIFEEDTPLKIIQQLRPHVLVKGSDYAKDDVVGKNVVESYGGRIELVQIEFDQSTSQIVEKIVAHYTPPQ